MHYEPAQVLHLSGRVLTMGDVGSGGAGGRRRQIGKFRSVDPQPRGSGPLRGVEVCCSLSMSQVQGLGHLSLAFLKQEHCKDGSKLKCHREQR